MSKGTPRVTLRVPEELRSALQEVIDRSELFRAAGAWDTTSLILQAVKDKLNHMERSRRSRRKSKLTSTLERKVICENCSLQFLAEEPGSITICPDGSRVAVCWDCLIRVGPFAPPS
jgi:hypothetical protein